MNFLFFYKFFWPWIKFLLIFYFYFSNASLFYHSLYFFLLLLPLNLLTSTLFNFHPSSFIIYSSLYLLSSPLSSSTFSHLVSSLFFFLPLPYFPSLYPLLPSSILFRIFGNFIKGLLKKKFPIFWKIIPPLEKTFPAFWLGKINLKKSYAKELNLRFFQMLFLFFNFPSLPIGSLAILKNNPINLAPSLRLAHLLRL